MEETSINKNRKIDRFDKYVITKGLNDNKVTTDLGISVGTLGKSRKSNRDLSDRNIELILNHYIDLSRIWLLTGEGEMIKNEEKVAPAKDSYAMIPLLPIAAQGGSLNDFVISAQLADCEKIISPINGVDFAITVAGDSMQPEYPSGSQILIKKINERAFIEWGKVYVLDTCNGTVVKELHKAASDDRVDCFSLNPNPKYQPYSVALADIYGIYRVMMCMSIK